MSRSLSSAMRAALYAQETSEVILVLLTLSHPSISTQRFVNNMTNIVSRGNTYVAYPFDLILPDDRDDEPVHIRLSIDAIDRSLIQAIRAITSRPSFVIELIRAAAPDVVEAGPFACMLTNVQYDAHVISGDLSYEDILNEGFPQHTFSPNYFPGLFA